MAVTIRPGETERDPIDDYQVAQPVGEVARPATYHVVAVLNALLLIVLAAVSFALFWIVATLLGLV